MRFNEDLLNQLAWEEVMVEQISQQKTPLDKMREYLENKYPNKFSNIKGLYLSDLYRIEANLEFSEAQLRRFKRTEKFGYAKACPIYKFLQQPTLF